MLRRSIPSLVLAITVLAVPATAAATTYTVDPTAAAGCSGTVCKTILDANAKVAAGDTVEIKDGAYTETGPIVVTKNDVTFRGLNAGKVGITQADGQHDTPVFQLGQGTVLDNVAIAVQRGGGEAVRSTALGAVVRNAQLLRIGENDRDVPVVSQLAPSGRLSLDKVIIAQAPTATGDARAAAIANNATSSVYLTDSIVVTGAATGPGLLLNGQDASLTNAMLRTQIVVGEPGANAVTINSTDTHTGATELDLDSSILSSGAQGIGIAAANAASASSVSGPITIKGTHVTIAGGQQPLSLTAGAFALGNPITGNGIAGPVTATLDKSIVHGSAPSTTKTSANLIGTKSVATIALSNSDVTDSAGGDITLSATQKSEDAALFADATKRNYHLRLGSPAIDKGGAVGPTDSAKDIDQQDRLVGAASDLGADEFVSLPPIAKIAASATNVREGQQVGFDASGSGDLDAGGTIAAYRWEFGDGMTAETAAPTTTHAYAKAGSYTPKVTVVDSQGTPSQPAAAPAITVIEGTPPTVRITTPTNKKTLRIFKVKKTKVKSGKNKGKTRTTRTRNTFYFRGSAADASGIAKVEVSVQRTAVAKRKAKTSASSCVYLDGKTSVVTRKCTTPLFFPVKIDSDGFWVYHTKKALKLRAGTYRVSARATDKAGNVSAPVSITITLK